MRRPALGAGACRVVRSQLVLEVLASSLAVSGDRQTRGNMCVPDKKELIAVSKRYLSRRRCQAVYLVVSLSFLDCAV